MKKLLVCLMAVGLAVPALVHGQTYYSGQRAVGVRGDAPRGILTGGMTSADTLFHPTLTDASGNLYIRSFDITNTTFQEDIINNNALILTARVDSSLTGVTLAGFSRAALVLNAQLDSLTSSARIAIQVRGSYTPAVDTSATFPWFRMVNNSTATGAYGADTLHVNTFAAGDSITPGSGEMVWTVQPLTYTANQGISPTDAHKFTIPLVGMPEGAGFPFPYVSVRVRLLHLGGTGKRVVLRASVVGVY